VRRTGFLLAALAVACPIVSVGASSGRRLAPAPKCPVFPRSSHWNKRVDRLPVHPRSEQIVGSIGRSRHLHADFGAGLWEGGPIGIPYKTVSKRQRRVPVSFEYADESDPSPYPIPRNVPIEGGRSSDDDRHVVVVDRDRCRLYELFAAYPRDGGAFIYPARHFASSSSDPSLPAMGQRLRLKRSFDVSGFPRQARVVLRALKRYGMIVADNGSPWYVSGVPSSRWDNDDLHTLHRVNGSDFEVVDTRYLPKPRG
jgi:hypothetical protein